MPAVVNAGSGQSAGPEDAKENERMAVTLSERAAKHVANYIAKRLA